MSTETRSMRWDPYILTTEKNFDSFWGNHLSNPGRDILFIVGRGFDHRATLGSERIRRIGGDGRRDAMLVCFDNGLPDSLNRDELTRKNVERYKLIFQEFDFTELELRLATSGNQSQTSRNTSKIVSEHREKIVTYDDIIIDISAMPRMVAITLVVKILHLLDSTYSKGGRDINLHILTAESVQSDKGALPASLSDGVTSVVGFSGELNGEATEHIPRIWFPVLGEDQEERLTRIREEIRPNEISPVIPFPSKNPRRSDELINVYRQTLFDDFQIDPRNIIHASEINPFEAYKQIFAAIHRYHDSLKELGGCKAYVSPLSSKLLSIGAVLACYEHRDLRYENLKVGIPYVEVATYGEPAQSPVDEIELYSMWIRGEWER